ncbi:30S ribosomal protein S17 [Candidatus Gottesmanbacteria bacterium RIFCSPLOWO2_01_FULL_46_9]|uniref:30S ribosomal protein S17 n=1 Tax=Candidatus Gottesmanbacteria bacterium RIFCSPLOWO2_01_FULL_46_9 TaxID=1798394 RepID=A0A1F6B3Z6_9BACT|nr:MAG: 30S ribosomal protein S17 [Candidatus Gottesmanbacteria bacterium RIFCSPLOWO2_01_FULL_46_9]
MNKPVEITKGKVFSGEVISAKTPMTVIVAVVSTHRHPLYKKAVKKTKHVAVHNTSLALTVGDKVTIREIRPVTKTKHFIAVEKIL